MSNEDKPDGTMADEPPPADDAGNRTMQIDAFSDELLEARGDVPADAVLAEVLAAPLVPQISMPPPLPPKKPSKILIGLGVFVVFLAIGAGVYVGSLLLAPKPPPPTPPAPAATTDEGEVVPIQLDTFVVGAEEEGETPPPE